MSRKQHVIEVQARTADRVKNVKGRKQELIPAVIYGPKQDPTPVFIPKKFFVFHGTAVDNSLYTLSGDVLNGSKVMFKDISVNPLGTKILHADLYVPDLTKPVRVEIPLHFVGDAVGVEEQDGVLQVVRREIEIECPAADIPEFIEVDVSALELHDSLKIEDVKVDEKFRIFSAPEWTIVTVAEVKEEVEEVDEEAEATAAAEEEDAEDTEEASKEGSEKKKDSPDKNKSEE